MPWVSKKQLSSSCSNNIFKNSKCDSVCSSLNFYNSKKLCDRCKWDRHLYWEQHSQDWEQVLWMPIRWSLHLLEILVTRLVDCHKIKYNQLLWVNMKMQETKKVLKICFCKWLAEDQQFKEKHLEESLLDSHSEEVKISSVIY